MLIASAALVTALGWYAVPCAVKPFAPCRRCVGRSEIAHFGKPRMCPRCRGHRPRLRLGRRVHDAWCHTQQ
ncbi:hypothetical protein [Streptomyces goshikiensis]|uniref:hypothetical protein n=1 Tax=Streptomyces goshikiensis TaxID=1942 RepID=UPI00331828A7